MAKKTAKLLPSTAESLQLFGERLRLARKRRRLTARQVAELAGMAPMTLRSLERGGSGVTIGAYLSVMQVLGIERDIELLAKADPVGRELQDAQLSAPRRKRTRHLAPEAAKSREPTVAATAHALRPTRSPGAAQSPHAANPPPGEAKEPPLENDLPAKKGLREKGLQELQELQALRELQEAQEAHKAHEAQEAQEAQEVTNVPREEHSRRIRNAARAERMRNAPPQRLPSAPDAPPPEQLRMAFDLPLDEPVQPTANGPAQTSIGGEDESLADSSDIANRPEPI